MEKIKDFLKKIKLKSLITALALIIVGILFIVFPENAMVVICRVSGAALMIWGVVMLIDYILSGKNGVGSYALVGAIALCACGVLLLVKPGFVSGILTLLFGILLIIDSVMKVQQAVDMAKLKIKTWWLVLIIAIATLALGFVIVFDPFNSASALLVFLGVSLLVDGLLDIATVVYYTIKVDKVKDRKNVIDI